MFRPNVSPLELDKEPYPSRRSGSDSSAKFTAHAVNLILRQPRVTKRPSSANSLIKVSPMRSQLATVSAIKILLVGVERLILAPQ